MGTSRGQSLVSVLIAIGMMGILAAGMSSMFQTQARESRALSEKLGSLDFQRLITGTIAVPTACTATVNTLNVLPGQTLTFNPNSIVSTDPLKPTVIASLGKLYGNDGVSVLADTAATQSLTSLVGTLILRGATGLQVAGYKQGAAISYSLLANFDQTKLARPIRDLNFPILVTTAPAGALLQIVGCHGAAPGGGGPGPGSGVMCGNRTVFCGFPASTAYDNRNFTTEPTWRSANIPCEGNTLTAACTWNGNPMGNVFVTSVMGCPTGFTGHSTQIGCAGGDDCNVGGNVYQIAQIFCVKD